MANTSHKRADSETWTLHRPAPQLKFKLYLQVRRLKATENLIPPYYKQNLWKANRALRWRHDFIANKNKALNKIWISFPRCVSCMLRLVALKKFWNDIQKLPSIKISRGNYSNHYQVIESIYFLIPHSKISKQ